MVTVQRESDVNLEELRRQLACRLALLLVGALTLLMWPSLPGPFFPAIQVSLLALLVGLCASARVLAGARPVLARHLLVWGLTVGLLGGMWLLPDPWLPFLGILMAFLGAALIPGSELATTGLVLGLAAWLSHNGVRAYSLSGLVVALVLGVAVAWLIVRTMHTALDWAWTMQLQATHLLDVARDRQAELSRALKSLDQSNMLLNRTQRELIFARQQEEKARRMKEQFAANISHELRTPLNLILGFGEVMYLTPQVYGDMHWPPTLRRDVYQIYRSSRHLLDMIDDILDLSRFEMVGFTLNKEPTPLAPLLQETIEIAEDIFRDSPIRLEADISQDLPMLELDRIRVRQVLLNLLNNAARFTEQGMVRVEAKRVDGEVVISVSDTGPGIPEKDLAHIFEEFYQVDRSLHRKHGGAGLGLAICKRFVKAHEGRIWAESEEGVGSTFFFALPILGHYVPAAAPYFRPPTKVSRPQLRPPILVVDPDPSVAILMDRHMDGYEVVQVADVERVAEAVLLRHPHAVVYNVPPGKQLVHDSALCAPVPCVECSLPSQAWIADDLAVAACLTKPFTSKRLLQEIARVGDIHDVLIIDDDRGFCQLVTRVLKATGWSLEVRRAYDGEQGWQALQFQRPDLVLLDLIMPSVDGFQVLEWMRQDSGLADVPVIVVTATSYAEDALAKYKGQVTIRRPNGLSPDEVLRCLRAVIDVLEPYYDERSAPELALVGSGA